MNKDLKVCWLTCTKGRHTMLERNVKMFLDQDYENKIMVIYNNSPKAMFLDKSIMGKGIILINQHIDSKTGEPYTNLGAIYNDTIAHIPNNVDLLVGADDDDIYLPNHISEGVKGYIRGKDLNSNCKAYKPKFSYYKYLTEPVSKVCNVLEPSIFVKMSHIREHGYHNNTENQHHKWLDALGTDIFVDEDGVSTYFCDWNVPVPTWKTSGDPTNPQNFQNYINNSQDFGDSMVTPIDSCEKFYNLVKEVI